MADRRIPKELALAAFIVAGSLGHAFAQMPPDPVGDWQGTLSAGGAELRLVLHITKTDASGFQATIDSIDQPGANGIPVTSISLKGSDLILLANSIHASYNGKFNGDATVIDGTWTQSQPIPLSFRRVTAAAKTAKKQAMPSEIDGDWLGAMDTGTMKLRMVFHITNTGDGLTATLDVPDQGAKGIPATSITRSAQSILVAMKQMGAKFEGKLNSELSAIDGAWSQGGASLPLVLKRVKDTAQLERRRPQDPVPPYPYRSEDIEYPNNVAGIKLAATLTIPKGAGPFPAAVLITGSGPQDRDEALMGHKPFLVLSDYLTRRGIAVLRTDDRGVSKSGGTFATATTADFATDTEAGVNYLKTRAKVNPHKIGLIGHSEGGVIAPMVAARNPDIAFIVMMAGSGVPGYELIAEQTLLISEASGASHDAAEKNADDERAILAIVRQEKDEDVRRKKLREALAGKVPDTQMDMQIKQITSPWYRYFLAYDPAPALRKVKCPVLAIDGEKDLQVAPQQNLAAIRKALEEGGNKNIDVVELPGLNHLFQTAKTGMMSEYSEIEETIAPVALETMANWILKQ